MTCGSRHDIPYRQRAKPRRRSGFTLLELVLVLALLVAVAGLAWPVMEGAFDGVRLRKAADAVCTAWGNARLSAMTEGAIYVFRFQPGDDHYQVEPWGQTTQDPEATDSAGPAALRTSVPNIAVAASGSDGSTRGRLPEGILFGRLRQDGTTTTNTDEELGTPLDSEMILFYPDGTTSHVTISLQSDRQSAVAVSLRGITGASSVSEPITADELGW